MKKVILKKEQLTINVLELDDSYFIGIEFNNSIDKSLIKKIGPNLYAGMSIRNNNYTCLVTGDSINSVINKFCDVKDVVATKDKDEFTKWFVS